MSKKRQTHEEKRNQSIIDLINQMFIIAGHEVTYDDVKDRKDDWFNDWTMTIAQREEWEEWSNKYLMKKLKMSVRQADKEMLWISLMWGLKLDTPIFKLQQDKIPVTLDDNGNLHMDQLEDLASLLTQGKPNWKLVRSRDGLTKHSVDVLWIEFNEDRTFKAKHEDFAIGRSLLMSPFNEFFTWQTTPITKIIAEATDSFYLKFETENSEYVLSKIYEEATGTPI